MPLSSRFVVLQLLLPTAAGLGIAYLALPQRGSSSTAPSHESIRQPDNLPALPDDPQLIRLAALSGRTAEARQKLAAALTAGAKNDELAEWLVPILIADPAWLDQFITTVPEERRVVLIRVALKKLTEVQPDSLWELLRRSPTALAAGQAKIPGNPYSGPELFLSAGSSPLAAEVLFDPELHFDPKDIDQFCRFSLWTSPGALRILEEWRDDRWKGGTPEWIRSAWLNAKSEDPSGLERLESTLPENQQAVIAKFNSYRNLTKEDTDPGRDFDSEKLSELSRADLADLCERQAMAGKPIPLETLQNLKPELRGDAIHSYLTNLYPFSADVARDAIDRLDGLNLSAAEKQNLLYEAGCQECNELRDYDTAMQWFARIGDESVRTRIQNEALDKLMNFDPEKALTYIRQLPPGERREKLEKAANEALP